MHCNMGFLSNILVRGDSDIDTTGGSQILTIIYSLSHIHWFTKSLLFIRHKGTNMCHGKTILSLSDKKDPMFAMSKWSYSCLTEKALTFNMLKRVMSIILVSLLDSTYYKPSDNRTIEKYHCNSQPSLDIFVIAPYFHLILRPGRNKRTGKLISLYWVGLAWTDSL